jgi:hypothetical protein
MTEIKYKLLTVVKKLSTVRKVNDYPVMTCEDHRITKYAWQAKETFMNHFLHKLAKRTENFRKCQVKHFSKLCVVPDSSVKNWCMYWSYNGAHSSVVG